MTDATVVADATPAAAVADATPAAAVADATPAVAAVADNTAPAAAEDKPAPAAAVDYTDFKLPEGFDAAQIQLDEVKGLAKELGLDQANAQKLVDRVIKQRTDFEGAQSKTQADVVAGWATEARQDPEIGGDKFDVSLASARSVIENPKLVNPEFKAFLDASGLGNHPEMIRTFARIAPVFANDTPVTGGAGGVTAADPFKGLYSNSNHN